MENINTQTEVIATYETSRTRRSLVEENMLNNASNNDDEYESNGFYVREKTTSDKRPDSDCSSSVPGDDPEAIDAACVENSASNPLPNNETPGAEACDNRNGVESPETTNAGETPDTAHLSTEGPEEEKYQDDQASLSTSDHPETNANKDESESLEPEDDKDNPTEGAIEDQTDNVIENEEDSTDLVHVDERQPTQLDKTDSDKEDTADSSSIVGNDPDLANDETTEQSTTTQNETKEVSVDQINEKESPSAEETRTDTEPTKVQNVDNQEPKESIEDLVTENESKGDGSSNEEKKQNDEDSVLIENNEDVTETTASQKDGDADSSKNQDVIDVDATKAPQLVDAVDLTLEEDALNTNVTKKTAEKSILKGTLEKHATSESNDPDMEMDDDFDPSLLCPDISMDVDEAPVVTNESQTSGDGSVSPLPYEPIFSTLVDEITGAEVQVDLTPAEMELRHQMYGPNNLVQKSKIHCTACNVHLGSAMIGANNRFVHPLLKVLICKNCYHFYTSGEFEKDEDGSELYCRWCGQGGQVLCCSSCEFVFCKRCIRNNFGVKKFKEIRNSDDWNCFRCHPEQLSSLRASCAEFMEYYRTELARAQSLSTKSPELMTTDYTTCCNTPEKKAESKSQAAPKNRRKRKGEDEDPDYYPIINNDEPPQKKPVPAGGPGYTIITANGPRPILPKLTANPAASLRPTVPNSIRPQALQGQVYRVGNTTFRNKSPASVLIQRLNSKQDVRNSSPGYITIPPSSVSKTTSGIYFQNFTQLRTSTAPVRAQGAFTVVSGTNNGTPTYSTVRSLKTNQVAVMKHEWFEKTVRATARVNSNLSYTLTQLNRQQSQAANVEALATVHNKLQEVLSTSINSLIQIRKNLRTEFIAGIKTIKFPPKAVSKPVTAPIVVNDDDDVIFVNPISSASQPQSSNPKVPSAILVSKKSLQKHNPFGNPKPSTSGLNSMKITKTVATSPAPPAPIKGGFLKVRSFTSLQTVPSECITIPDDPIPKRTIESEPLSITLDDDPLAIPVSNETKSDPVPEAMKVSKPDPKVYKSPASDTKVDTQMVFNVKRKPTPLVKKMMNAIVILEKSPDVDKLANKRGK